MSGECDDCKEHAVDCECKPDLVNNPSHYQGRNLQAIDVIEAFDLGFCLGNADKNTRMDDRR